MLLLALEMQLNVPTTPYTFTSTKNQVYNVPYDNNGCKLSPSSTQPMMQLNLQRGAKLKLTGGPGKGYLGHVIRTSTQNEGKYSFTCQFPCTRENSKHQGKKPSLYSLGGWMIEAACRGELKMLPVVNC